MFRDRFNISTSSVRFIGVTTCVVSALVFSLLIGFSYSRYLNEKGQLKKSQAGLLEAQKDMQNLEELLRGYKEERERFSKILFSDRDIATFLEEFGEFAKKAKVKIRDMKVQAFREVSLWDEAEQISRRYRDSFSTEKKEKEGVYLRAMPINVVVEGNFKHIVDFLLFLERYRQLLTLSNVRIDRRTYPILECGFTLSLYSLKQLEEEIERK